MTNLKPKKSTDKLSITWISLVIILIILGILIGLILSNLCISDQQKIKNKFNSEIEYSIDIITNSIQLFNNARNQYETAYDDRLSSILDTYKKDFERAGGKPENVDLEKLKSKYILENKIDLELYIIDDNSTIIAGTEKNSVNYNFSETPEFIDQLTKMRLSNESHNDAFVSSYSSKAVLKWGYIPTDDHKYLLEIGLSLDSPFAEAQNIYPTEGLTPQFYPSNIFLFSREAIIKGNPHDGVLRLGSSTTNLTEYEDRQKNLIRSFNNNESFVIDLPEENKQIYYSYIKSFNSDVPSGEYLDRVVELTIDTTPLYESMKSSAIFFIIIIGIAIFAMTIFGIIIIRYVIRPIDQIIEDIEIIADGDYEHEIHSTRGVEFYRLENSIKKMITNLKIQLDENQIKTDTLNTELKERKIIEKALHSTANKLKLLTSITRHDILNQISIILGILEIMQINLGEDHPEVKNIISAETAADNIKDQILFTRIYEEMGIKEPIWQGISLCIAKAEHDLSYDREIIKDLTGQSIFILADQMFDRVVYNLLDNASRYATGMTLLTITFQSTPDGSGILCFSDNGPGVPADKKELIFNRGYGNNTGFGLFLVREILSITDIEITEVGIPGEGAKFKLVIPKNYWKKE